MKKILALLILICCFSTSIYASESTTSTTFNPDLNKENIKKATTDVRPKFRIGFDAPQINHRQLLLTIDENCTDGVDWGYDGQTPQVLADDMYWLINNTEYVIQGTDSVFIGKEIPLGVVTTNGGVITIKIDALENPIEGLKVGLKDTALNIIHKLEESDYQVTLEAGVYHDRFLLVFLSPNESEVPASDDTITEETTEESEPIEDEASALPAPPPGFVDTDTTGTEEGTSEDEETEATEEDTNDAGEGTTAGEEEVNDETTETDADESETNEDEETEATEEDTNDAGEGTTAGEEEVNDETTETDADESETNEEATETDAGEDESTESSDSEASETEEDETEGTDISNDKDNTNQSYFNKNKLIIYVNNGQSILNIKNKRGLKINRIVLFNRNGQKVKIWNKNLNTDTIQFELQVKRGVYLVMVQTDKGRVIKRVLIQNS